MSGRFDIYTPTPNTVSDTTNPTTQPSLTPSSPAKKLSLARNGLLPISIPSFLGNHIADTPCITKLALTAAWAAALNLGRKGDATKLLTLGASIFGEAEFDSAVEQAIAQGAAGENIDVVRAGFAKIDVEAFMGEQDDVQGEREMLRKMLVGGWGALLGMRRMGEAEVIEEMGRGIFGGEEWESVVQGMLEGYVLLR